MLSILCVTIDVQTLGDRIIVILLLFSVQQMFVYYLFYS